VKNQPWVFGIQITLITLFVFLSVLFTPVIMTTVDESFIRLKDETICFPRSSVRKKNIVFFLVALYISIFRDPGFSSL
jgi:hypothetical protein